MKIFLSLGLFMSSLSFASESQDISSDLQAGTLLCLDIYDPAECQYLDLRASGTNSCSARLALQALAAAKGIEINPSEVVCQSGL